MTFCCSVPDFNQPFDPRDSDEIWPRKMRSTDENVEEKMIIGVPD